MRDLEKAESPSYPRDDVDATSGEYGREGQEERVSMDDKSSRRSSQQPPSPDQDGDPDTSNDQEANVARVRSRASSRSKALSIVPRSKRRGLFGRFAVIPEVDRPYDYSNKTKWTLTLIVALAGAGAPLGSSIIWPAMTGIIRSLDTDATIANLSVAFYMLAMSIFPLWWSSFSETLGRRTIYLISFALFIVFSVVSAVSTSITMFIILRILGGGASASVQAVGAGTIADVWEPRERGRAMGFFYLGPLMGPLLSPIIGGALAEGFGWRAVMWFLAIYGGVIWLMIFFCLPETLAKKQKPLSDPSSVSLSRTASRVSTATKKTGKVLKRYIIEPLEVLTYLRFPPILLTVSYAAVTFGALFVLNVSIQTAFSSPPYSYNSLTVGLLYLPPSLGYALASVAGGRWIDRIMRREAVRANRVDEHGKLIFLPEDRMRENAWLSATLFPAGLIWYGWSVQEGLHWEVAAVASLLFGIGAMLVFGAATTMLTEFMPKRSSSGVAINNFVRNIFSCVGAVVGDPMIRAMGHGWSCTLWALVAWVGGNLCIWLLRRNASRWRVEMDKRMNL